MSTDPRIENVLRSFSLVYLGGIPSTITDDSAFLSFVCVLSGTEALAGYRYPDVPGNGDRFKAFVHEYFVREYQPYVDDLWYFRNAMVHAFSTGRFVLTHHRTDTHLRTTDDGAVILNAEDFYGALLAAAQRYFEDVRRSPELQKGVLTRLADAKGGAIVIAERAFQ